MPWGPEVILQIDGHNLWGLSDEAMAADLVSERERERVAEITKRQNGLYSRNVLSSSSCVFCCKKG